MKLDNGKASDLKNDVLGNKTKSNFDVNFNHNQKESINGKDKNEENDKIGNEQQDQEFVFFQETCFNVKIDAPGVEPFSIQVRFFNINFQKKILLSYILLSCFDV